MMSFFSDTFNFIKKNKKVILSTSTIIIGASASVYYYLKSKEKCINDNLNDWENEYAEKLCILKKKHEYLLSAYSCARHEKMKEYYQKILNELDESYDVESIKENIKNAENTTARASEFSKLGKIIIARDVSFSVISCFMIIALECQANVIAYEMSHQSGLKTSSTSTDSEAYFTQTFLEMISLFASKNNLRNIINKIDEIVFTDMEIVDLKKSFSKEEFIKMLTQFGNAILQDDYFKNISNKFVPNMKFVRQQQVELIVLFEEYVDLIDTIQQSGIINLLVEKYLLTFGNLICDKLESNNAYYIELLPKITETYEHGVRKNKNFDCSEIIKEIQEICYDKLINKKYI
uniref:Peroxisomal assembly protein PEX3 n=1 Tax=Parastrongyloides trichosuri TaxID=131310 RepID=A0A0N4ZTG5_PARTI